VEWSRRTTPLLDRQQETRSTFGRRESEAGYPDEVFPGPLREFQDTLNSRSHSYFFIKVKGELRPSELTNRKVIEQTKVSLKVIIIIIIIIIIYREIRCTENALDFNSGSTRLE
jgi:hypothetical protein